MLISNNLQGEISGKKFTSSQTSVLQDHMVTCVTKKVFFQEFGTGTKNGSF